jgi:hypothetical protein
VSLPVEPGFGKCSSGAWGKRLGRIKDRGGRKGPGEHLELQVGQPLVVLMRIQMPGRGYSCKVTQ